MSSPALVFTFVMMPVVTACSLPRPRDFDGSPLRAVSLVATFEGGVMAVERSNSPARVIVELQLPDLPDFAMDDLGLRVDYEPPLRPTRLDRTQSGCDARRDRARQVQGAHGDASLMLSTIPCLLLIRAEFMLPEPPTVNDSLFIIARGRSFPVRWYRR